MLPDYVFAGVWKRFFFAPASIIQQPPGLLHAFSLLRQIEQAQVVCLLARHEDANSWGERLANPIFVSEALTPAVYHDLLYRRLIAESGFSFVAATEVGGWCLFADLQNDVAVIGFRDVPEKDWKAILDAIGGGPLDDLIRFPGGSYPFNEERFVWEAPLRVHYESQT